MPEYRETTPLEHFPMSFLNLTRTCFLLSLSAFTALGCSASAADTAASSSSLEQSPTSACTRGVLLEDDWQNGVPSSFLFDDLAGATDGVTSISGVVTAHDYTHLHFPTPATAHLEAFSEIRQEAGGSTVVSVAGMGDATDPASLVARGLFEAMTQAHQVHSGTHASTTVTRASNWGYYICAQTTDMFGVRYECNVATTGHVTADVCP